jgi:penicillin-binding protein 2
MNDRLGSGGEGVGGPRLWLVAAGIVAVFALFTLRLFQLQIVDGEILNQQSERNSIRTLRLVAPRGDILDREGRVLATTRPSFSLEVLPSELRRPERTFRALGQLLDQDPERLEARVGHPRGRARFQPVRLVSDLPFEELARVETHRYALPGVLTDVSPRRQYVDGDLFAHVLGTIGEIRADQLEKPEYQDYGAGDVVGQSGLEAELEPQLRGQDGGRNVVVDVAGREVELLDEVEPAPGAPVRLTLDTDLQRAAVEGFAPERPDEPERQGALVALDPRTGDVLALVSRPSFDPNAFAGGVDPATWRALMHDERKPLQDRAIAGQYPPGSTYKAIVAAAALEEGVANKTTRVFCPGSFWFGGRRYGCWRKEGHGSVDVHSALVRSCDVFFYEMGTRIGIDRLAFYARSFGLGQPTGIALPDEKGGLVPSSEWKKRRFGVPWYPGETVSAAIGQGYNLLTPLQLAVAYAAIANGGHVVKPRLVMPDLPPGVTEEPASFVSDVPVKPENLAIVREGLTGVVEEPGGTGARGRVPGVRVAGKTGTAQVAGLQHFEGLDDAKIPLRFRDHAWFVAFAPADHAEIVVAVLAEHGGHGGSAAAPIAQKVLARYFEKKAAREGLMQAAAPEHGPAVAVDGGTIPVGRGPRSQRHSADLALGGEHARP